MRQASLLMWIGAWLAMTLAWLVPPPFSLLWRVLETLGAGIALGLLSGMAMGIGESVGGKESPAPYLCGWLALGLCALYLNVGSYGEWLPFAQGSLAGLAIYAVLA